MVVPTGCPLLGSMNSSLHRFLLTNGQINHRVSELTSRRPPRLFCPMLGSLQLGFNQLGLALSPWFKTGPLRCHQTCLAGNPLQIKRCEWETPGNPL